MVSSHVKQTLISLNNQGASLIDAGRPLGAISILVSALKFFKEQLLSEPQDTSVVLRHCYSLDDSMMSRNITYITNGSCTNSDFVHRRSIHVQQDTLCNVHSVVIAVAILFNLALAHHLTGVEKSRNPVLLKKAVKLYEHALTLARTQGVGEYAVLFHLAVMNNLGQLHKELKQDVLAEKCFHQLLSMLMYLLDCSKEEEDALSSSYEEFLSSVYHLIFPGCSAVAPAA
jgi:tetratricopeptide (TPR) repeat protein